MNVKVLQSDAPLDEHRVIIRRHEGDVEMVELPWGLRPSMAVPVPSTWYALKEGHFRPTVAWCRHPRFRHRSGGRNFSFSLASGDWFYFAGIWRPATDRWPEAYAILTIEANADISAYHDRRMAVLERNRRMNWLDGLVREDEISRLFPPAPFVSNLFRTLPFGLGLRSRVRALTGRPASRNAI